MIRQLISVFGLFFVVALVFYGMVVVKDKAPDTPRNRVSVYLYFHDHLYPVRRSVESGADPVTTALQALIAGPTEKEYKQGLITQIPLGVKVTSVEIHEDVANVFFGPEFLKISGGAAQIEGILSQVVYTATQFPQVKSVLIRIVGKPARSIALGGEGYIIDGPITKDYFKRR